MDSNVHWKLYGLSVRHKAQLAASHKQQQIPRDVWNISINNLDDCTEGILSKCVGEHKQGTLECRAASEGNLARMEKCVDKNPKVQQNQGQFFS